MLILNTVVLDYLFRPFHLNVKVIPSANVEQFDLSIVAWTRLWARTAVYAHKLFIVTTMHRYTYIT